MTSHDPRCQLNRELGPISNDLNITVTLYKVSFILDEIWKRYSLWHNPLWKKSNKPTYSLFSYGTINPPYSNLEHEKWYQFMSMQCSLETSENFALTITVIFLKQRNDIFFIINCGFKPKMTSYFNSASHIYAPFSGLATWQMLKFSLLPVWINWNITIIRWVLRAHYLS